MNRTLRRVTVLYDAYLDYVLELCNGLESAGLEVVAVGPARWAEASERLLAPGIGFVPIDHRRIRDPRRIFAARRAVEVARATGSDLVHLQQTGDPWLAGAVRTSFRNLPVVQTVHDVRPHPGDSSQTPGVERWWRVSRAVTDRYIVHGRRLADDLARVWGVPPSSIDVVAHGELGSLYRRDARRCPRTSADAFTVLSFGRRYDYKGFDLLVDALDLLAEYRDDLRLIVAGTGEDPRPALGRLRGRVEIEVLDRYLDSDDTVEVFARATVACLPYREASQSGVAALAIGLGVPLVATDVGALAELVGSAGILVPAGDADALAGGLARVLDDPMLRCALAREAAAAAAANGPLHWSKVADDTISVYERALST